MMYHRKKILQTILIIFSLFSIVLKITTIKAYPKDEPSVHLIMKLGLSKSYRFKLFEGYVSIRTTYEDFDKLRQNSLLLVYDENSFLGERLYDYLVSIGWLLNLLSIILCQIVYKIKKHLTRSSKPTNRSSRFAV